MANRYDKAGMLGAALVALGYCCWPYLTGPEAGVIQEPAKAALGKAKIAPATSNDPPADPFRLKLVAATQPVRVAAKPPLKPDARQAVALKDLRSYVKGLQLNATFLRGQRRTAIINGQEYAEGDPLKGTGEPPCLLARVTADHVVLRRSEETEELTYSNTSTMPGKPAGKSTGKPSRGTRH